MDHNDANNAGEPADDALARATAALRDVAVPDGPPPTLLGDP